MFGIGFSEMVVVVVLILIAVGPDKLPTMIRTVARTYRQFRRTAMDLRASTGIDDFLRDEELKELAELRKQKLLTMSKVAPAKPIAKPTLAPAHTGGTAPTAGASTVGHAATAATPHPVPHAKPAPHATGRGPTLAQRLAEAPPEGVDIAEAQRDVTTEAATAPAATAPATTAATATTAASPAPAATVPAASLAERTIPETRSEPEIGGVGTKAAGVAIPPAAKARA